MRWGCIIILLWYLDSFSLLSVSVSWKKMINSSCLIYPASAPSYEYSYPILRVAPSPGSYDLLSSFIWLSRQNLHHSKHWPMQCYPGGLFETLLGTDVSGFKLPDCIIFLLHFKPVTCIHSWYSCTYATVYVVSLQLQPVKLVGCWSVQCSCLLAAAVLLVRMPCLCIIWTPLALLQSGSFTTVYNT